MCMVEKRTNRECNPESMEKGRPPAKNQAEVDLFITDLLQ